MRGGSLTRFRPDDQSGQGFVRDLVSSSARAGWQGLKKGAPLGMPVNIAAGLRSAKRGGKQAIKRKALAEINRAAKRKLTDIFGS